MRRSSAPANSRRRLSACKNCQSSKLELSRRLKPDRKSSVYSVTALESGSTHAGQISDIECPCARHSASAREIDHVDLEISMKIEANCLALNDQPFACQRFVKC